MYIEQIIIFCFGAALFENSENIVVFFHAIFDYSRFQIMFIIVPSIPRLTDTAANTTGSDDADKK